MQKIRKDEHGRTVVGTDTPDVPTVDLVAKRLDDLESRPVVQPGRVASVEKRVGELESKFRKIEETLK